ncbi:MAG: hypothetical protein CL760_10190 [Chloroflexi bacterium]|nr:hypothetical protein [Chloroflexota bacterium]
MSYPEKIEKILSFEKKFENNIFYLFNETEFHQANLIVFIVCFLTFAAASLFFLGFDILGTLYIIAKILTFMYIFFFIFFSISLIKLKLSLAINPYISLKSVFYCFFLNDKFKEDEKEYNEDKEKIQKLIYSLTKEEYISLVSLKNDRKHKFFYNTIITYCIKDMTKNCYLDLNAFKELESKKTEEKEMVND